MLGAGALQGPPGRGLPGPREQASGPQRALPDPYSRVHSSRLASTSARWAAASSTPAAGLLRGGP